MYVLLTVVLICAGYCSTSRAEAESSQVCGVTIFQSGSDIDQISIVIPSSLALNRFKEFLNSNLLYSLYCDALSSGKGNFDFTTTKESPVSLLATSITYPSVYNIHT